MLKKSMVSLLTIFLFLPLHLLAQQITKAPAWSSFESFTFASDQDFLTNSLLVVKDGEVIYERYREGFQAQTKQQIWSMSKSISGLIIGKAINDKIIGLQDSVSKYYPEAPKDVTISHLLNMVSGLEWNEGYEYNPVGSDVINMLYTENYKDMARFTATKGLAYPAGSFFKYSSGSTNLLMGILSKAMGPNDYADYPWRSFFNLLDIDDVTWERDHRGTFVGSSYIFIKPRDLVKIGQLFLDQGRYKNKVIVEASWLEQSSTPYPYFYVKERDIKNNDGFAYSNQWWLNAALPYPDGSLKSRYPSLPADAILALGHWGQMLVILPEQKTIIVRTSQDKKGKLNRDEFFSLFMRAYEQAYP
ncbi:MAG: serine hydrolase [Bdellovibrionales bacterium CG12_big_fil_rev_8_21_14_0_65_38_15]|nr:MAG: serine hydrolase [Bdellovibrionales bacterium CG22_combo_CG10-13_8_21_14_all_38_13]PIQ55260.1 MAG: serine hydrolase [Bdellovibrionales bacterium CG12_big_fil_rev_8_21_14_0_65_38_15]PIR30492.1 MAG: serine hydrolase [Bdellovibrionales bacterium CG11_big_fil_rev_8_21_14_0_20_38_13]